MKRALIFSAKAAVLLLYAAAFALLAACQGCASIGRAGVGLVKVFAPEYAATADNLYGMLLDDQIVSSLDLELVLIASDGRVYRKQDLMPAIRAGEQRWTWDTVPQAYLRRLVGESAASKDLDAYKRQLADALKAVPAGKDKE